MKTVSGAVVSSKPVSLSKAAKILSKFALADNGASPAFVAYLKRASDSFDELVQLHKELKGSGSERKSKKHRSDNHDVEERFNSVRGYGVDKGRENGVVKRKKDVLDNRQDGGEDPKKKIRDNGVIKMEEKSSRRTSNLETNDGSVEHIKRKKERKKIKVEASKEGRSNGAVETEKEPSHGGHRIVNDIKSEVFEQTKNKAMDKGNEVEKRKNKTSGLRDQRYAGEGEFDRFGTDNAGEKKKDMTKQIHQGEGRESGSKVEKQKEKKGSKKRKSEDIADIELTDSAKNEMIKKKKKGKSEVVN